MFNNTFLYIKRTQSAWVPILHRTKKLLLMVSHDFWAQNQKYVIHGIWKGLIWCSAKYPSNCEQALVTKIKEVYFFVVESYFKG